MADMRIDQCFRVEVWRGHWMLRSVHATEAAARKDSVSVGRGVRVRIVPGTRRVATWRNAEKPGAAQSHRETAFDQMVIRRQANAYHKSGCNGTELLADPEKELS